MSRISISSEYPIACRFRGIPADLPSFYNQTEYSGLETDILNSYTNALLQALHYTTPIRAVAKAHICADCTKDHCLLCETGFLFRMLEDAKGVNCQASNFSRAFSATPQASALGLMDDNKNKSTSPYGSLIQNFNRWLMSTISAEAVIEGVSVDIRTHDISNLSLAETPSIIDQVLGIETVTTNTCVSCRHVTTREATLTTIDLAYPKKVGSAQLPIHLKVGTNPRRDLMRRRSLTWSRRRSREKVKPARHARNANNLRLSTPSVSLLINVSHPFSRSMPSSRHPRSLRSGATSATSNTYLAASGWS